MLLFCFFIAGCSNGQTVKNRMLEGLRKYWWWEVFMNFAKYNHRDINSGKQLPLDIR